MLLRGFIFIGEVEVKCRACKQTTTITGVNGNLSNDHRYILVTELDGVVIRGTSSAQKILGYTSEALVGMHAHDLLGFTPAHYAFLIKKLEKNPMNGFVFQSNEMAKNKKPFPVQVGVRYTTAITDRKILVFDIERNMPDLPKPLAPVQSPVKITKPAKKK